MLCHGESAYFWVSVDVVSRRFSFFLGQCRCCVTEMRLFFGTVYVDVVSRRCGFFLGQCRCCVTEMRLLFWVSVDDVSQPSRSQAVSGKLTC